MQRRKAALYVSQDASFFRFAGTEVDLRRRAAHRRILEALVLVHRSSSGRPISADDLFAAGWPGQSISPSSAQNRVKVAISELRKMGLREVLLSFEGVYAIDPRVAIEREH